MKKTNQLTESTLLCLLILFIQACNITIQNNNNGEGIENTSISADVSLTTDHLPGIGGNETQLIARLENPYILQGRNQNEVYLLVSVVGAKAKESKEKTPLNISLVIDRSGSMEGENKLTYVKKACNMAINNLTNTDWLSIVAYSNWARTLRESDKVTQKQSLKSAINSLSASGGTNLSGGMEEGYKQVKSTYKRNRINRVLLLSDGRANKGITSLRELQEIVKKKYADEHISISTFGVGADFNEDLMTNLAEHGKGNYHFIATSNDIVRIFRQELNGLLSVVGQNTKMELDFQDDYFEVQEVFGFNSAISGNKIKFDYGDIFSQEEKTVLIKLRIKKKIDKKLPFNVSLKFNDLNDKNQVKHLKQKLFISPTTNQALHLSSFDKEVTRNKLLFLANQQLEHATAEVDQGNYEKAKGRLNKNLLHLEKELKKIKPDSALIKQVNANKTYLKKIDNIKKMSVYERKMLQKNSKNLNYQLKTKKIK